MSYTEEEYKTYLKVKHELLLEDARNNVADWIADERNCYSYDLDDEELEPYDYEYLVSQFEQHFDRLDPFADTWQNIVNDYMEEEYKDQEVMKWKTNTDWRRNVSSEIQIL